MNTNYATQMVQQLEAKGESKDYIIGFLIATINGLSYLENEKVEEYLKRSVEHAQG